MELLANYNRVIDQHTHQGTLQHEIGQICRDALLQAIEATPNLGGHWANSPEERDMVNCSSFRSEEIKNWGIPLGMNCSHLVPEASKRYDSPKEFSLQLDFCSKNVVDGENLFSPRLSSSQVSPQHEPSFFGLNPGIGCVFNEQSALPPLEPSQNRYVASNFLPFSDNLSDANFQESNQAKASDDIFAGLDFGAVDSLGFVAFSQGQNRQGPLPPADSRPDEYHLGSEYSFSKDCLEAHLAQENNIQNAAEPHKDKNHGNRLLSQP